MDIILIDFETTSLDTKQARIIEIGAMRVDAKFSEPLASFSALVHDDSYPALTAEITQVTKITQDLLESEGHQPKAAFLNLAELITKDVAYAVAYNTQFDLSVFKEEMRRNGLAQQPQMSWLLSVPWLCALNDIETNYAFKSKRLMHVALEYGVAVDPKILHRAIADVELMRQMLVASTTTPEKMLAFQLEPWIYVAAKLEKPWVDGGKSTEFAKTKGYSWERARGDNSERTFPKQWIKRIKQKSFDDELTLPFQVERITI